MERDIKKVFGQNVQKYRKQFHLTQEALAEKINVSQTFLANIERGVRGVSMETIGLLADCFGIPYSFLFIENIEDIKSFERTEETHDKLFYHRLEVKLVDCVNSAVKTAVRGCLSQEAEQCM